MFDSVTSQLLQSAPAIEGLDPHEIPKILTYHYAELVSARLRGEEVGNEEDDEGWSLERIADTYEILASSHTDFEIRKSSAFVAGTAQQILSRREEKQDSDLSGCMIDRNKVDPTISAALLFLVAEQFADASEAALSIHPKRRGQLFEATILCEHISDLARGKMEAIIKRSNRWRNKDPESYNIEEAALGALFETLNCGIEMMASDILGISYPEVIIERFNSAKHAINAVLELTKGFSSVTAIDTTFKASYPGVTHLALLLLMVEKMLLKAALINVPAPLGANLDFWRKWIHFSATKFPFVWPNHQEAIKSDFYQTGKSAVMVLPTGAGKTTVSSLKIAGVLARNKKVIFLAPTHALVDQLTTDLQVMFPEDILNSVVSSDFDLLFLEDTQLQEIEIMTPERCLAMLSFAPEAFNEVGLLVFDECHLLSPQPKKIRRALDAMLCVLAFNSIVPEADTLFLSAMLKDGDKFGEWIRSLTGRDCISIDLLWKPSRQARGVVLYDKDNLSNIMRNAEKVQRQVDQAKGSKAAGLGVDARKELNVQPYAVWGLQHNWLSKDSADCIFSLISDETVPLVGVRGRRNVYLKPNVNHVAAKLAEKAAKQGLKTIVFVNQKSHTVSTAREITNLLDEKVEMNDVEKAYWDALEVELGGLNHSILDGPSIAVPHNAAMLTLERNLSERMFRRQGCANVIVATPTLAQGLNLPAHLAILAGDKRSTGKLREDLEPHEILNAAARAGRAGHLANGIVLLIPEPILSFSEDTLDEEVVEKLLTVLPEDDRCVQISDPLEIIFDRIMQGEILDKDVKYTINRMITLGGPDGGEGSAKLFRLDKSFAAFNAINEDSEAEYLAKLNSFKAAVQEAGGVEVNEAIALLASQSGIPMDIFIKLENRIKSQIDSLPISVEEWVVWILTWLSEDKDACEALLSDVSKEILGANGLDKTGELSSESVKNILPGLLGWIHGAPICEIEDLLGGDPNSKTDKYRVCPRARGLVGTIIPRSFSYAMGLISQVLLQGEVLDEQEKLSVEVVECLGTAIRLGFDNPEILQFAIQNKQILCRVQVHNLWAEQT